MGVVFTSPKGDVHGAERGTAARVYEGLHWAIIAGDYGERDNRPRRMLGSSRVTLHDPSRSS